MRNFADMGVGIAKIEQGLKVICLLLQSKVFK
jgi:hypothetical protein